MIFKAPTISYDTVSDSQQNIQIAPFYKVKGKKKKNLEYYIV